MRLAGQCRCARLTSNVRRHSYQMLHKVYCDTGAFTARLGQLERDGEIELYQFMYENKSRRFQGKAAKPSGLLYSDLKNYTYGDLGTDKVLSSLSYGEVGQVSAKCEEIKRIVGASNRRDVQHLDSAFLTGCTVFLTSDKGDIWSRREQLSPLLGFAVFHIPSEWDRFIGHVAK